MTGVLYGGTEIDGFPIWLANLWRVLLWCAIVFWVAQTTPRMWKRGVETGTTYWARYALLLIFARSAWVQTQNWEQPISWDGLPITTLALACTVMASYRYFHPAKDDPLHGRTRPRRPAQDTGHRRRATDR